jgi:hypothetical protein
VSAVLSFPVCCRRQDENDAEGAAAVEDFLAASLRNSILPDSVSEIARV